MALKPTQQEKLGNLSSRSTPGGGGFGSRWTTPLTAPNPTASAAQPVTPSGGGVLMQTYAVAAGGSSNDPISWAADPSFDIGPVSSYVALSSGALSLQASGWYEITVRGDMHSVTAGAGGEIYIGMGSDPITETTGGVAHPSGTLRISVSSGLFYFTLGTDDPTVYAGINSHDSSGSLTSAVIKIHAITGVSP